MIIERREKFEHILVKVSPLISTQYIPLVEQIEARDTAQPTKPKGVCSEGLGQQTTVRYKASSIFLFGGHPQHNF